jgi:hypothetical protein
MRSSKSGFDMCVKQACSRTIPNVRRCCLRARAHHRRCERRVNGVYDALRTSELQVICSREKPYRSTEVIGIMVAPPILPTL